MIINRRTFLGATAGLGIGSLAGITPAVAAAGLATGRRTAGPMPDEYEQILAATPDLKYLGCPRSWSVVEQGFLPIAADRVLILVPEHRPWHRETGDGWAYEHRSLRQRLGAKLAAKGMPLPDEKLALCVRIAFELTLLQRPGAQRRLGVSDGVAGVAGCDGDRQRRGGPASVPNLWACRHDQRLR